MRDMQCSVAVNACPVETGLPHRRNLCREGGTADEPKPFNERRGRNYQPSAAGPAPYLDSNTPQRVGQLPVRWYSVTVASTEYSRVYLDMRRLRIITEAATAAATSKTLTTFWLPSQAGKLAIFLSLPPEGYRAACVIGIVICRAWRGLKLVPRGESTRYRSTFFSIQPF